MSELPSVERVTLPAGWRITAGPQPAGGDAIVLDMQARPANERQSSTSMAFWRRRAAVFGRPGFPLGDVEIRLSTFPVLDELWTLFMLAWCDGGRAMPEAWAAMCRYAEDVRHGHWPDRVRPEQAVQSIYLAILQQHLARPQPDRERFLDEAFELCATVATKLSRGMRLLDDLLLAEPAFERYASILANDSALYREDLARARRFWATLPQAQSASGSARRMPLLAVQRPASTQFKLWARRDAEAPDGNGWSLLLVENANGEVVLSVNPAAKAWVGWLAAPLTAAERAAGNDAEWYDGARHESTLVASPRGGSRLGFDQVLAAVKGPLKLKPLRPAMRRWQKVAASVGTAVLIPVTTTGLKAVIETFTRGERPHHGAVQEARSDARGSGATDAVAAPGAKGQPLPAAAVRNLLESPEGPRAMSRYAVVAGVCGYAGERALEAPCDDARAVRDLLVNVYGYPRENVRFLVDRPMPGEAVAGEPTAAGLKLEIEKFRERFGADAAGSFLFYYSGHGGYEKGAHADFGLLQPSRYFDGQEGRPMSERGWDMQALIDDVRRGVPAKHVMLLLDCCYSGWAAGAKGDGELRPELMSLWRERAEVALTAGTRGQRAWEDRAAWRGSAFTAFLVAGLRPGPDGRLPADSSGDGVVTDEELAIHLRARVPPAVRELKRAEQVPQLVRFDGHLPESGQFLFVPASGRASAER